MDLVNYTATCGTATLQFNPDISLYATLKAFKEFIEQFEFCHITQYPVPLKNAIDCKIEKWQSQNKS